MKKAFSFLLICCFLLGLCACGVDNPQLSTSASSQPTQPVSTATPITPTEEEWTQLRAYCEIVNSLCYSDGYPIHGHVGQAAVKYCYEQLQGMGHLDKWIASEYLTPMYDLSPLGDLAFCARLPRQPIVDGFVTVENVLLSEIVWYTDALENKSIVQSHEYLYNKDGVLLSDFDSHPHGDRGWSKQYSLEIRYEYPLEEGTPEHTYDEQGNITQTRYLHPDGTVNCILQYTYNPDGSVATEVYKDRNGNEYTSTYTYDNGLLTKTEGVPYATNESITNVEYTYNENGQLIKEYHNRSNTKNILWRDVLIQYSYDSDGKLQSGTGVVLNFARNPSGTYLLGYGNTRYLTYTYDDAGRLHQTTYQEMGSYDENGNYISGKSEDVYYIDYSYGDFYIPPAISLE